MQLVVLRGYRVHFGLAIAHKVVFGIDNPPFFFFIRKIWSTNSLAL